MYLCHSVGLLEAVSFDRCLLVRRMAGGAGPHKHLICRGVRGSRRRERVAITLPY